MIGCPRSAARQATPGLLALVAARLAPRALVILTAFAALGADARAQSAGVAHAPDYSSTQSWLCRPDHLGACDVDLSTTVLKSNGQSEVERAVVNPKAAIDCFYVYPTVSTDTTDNSDLTPDQAERTVARLQFARFGTQCRLFAPVYRQVTNKAVGRAIATNGAPDFLGIAFDDVRAAWHYYLEHDNNGRGVVLIGHSQGSTILTELIRREIDGTPTQARIVSALLLGTPGGIVVPRARDVGGTFGSMPLCRAVTQTGCVVAYSAFRSTAPPTASSFFGRSSDTTRVAGCTDPAALAGGEAPLSGYFDAKGATALALGPTAPWTFNGQPIATPFVRVDGLLKGRCTSNAFASYLEVTVQRGAGSPASRDIQGDLIEQFGLHLVDVEVAMGNLVDLVGRQSAQFIARAPRR